MKTRKSSIKKDSNEIVAKLRNLKARGYQITSATVYSFSGILFFNRADMLEYMESLRG